MPGCSESFASPSTLKIQPVDVFEKPARVLIGTASNPWSTWRDALFRRRQSLNVVHLAVWKIPSLLSVPSVFPVISLLHDLFVRDLFWVLVVHHHEGYEIPLPIG